MASIPVKLELSPIQLIPVQLRESLRVSRSSMASGMVFPDPQKISQVWVPHISQSRCQ